MSSSREPISRRLLRLARPAAYAVVGIRAVFGAAFALRPDATMRELFGVATDSPPAKAVAAHYAVRDLALGAGLLAALRRQHGERAWMLAGTAADVVDGIAVVATAGRKSRGKVALQVVQMTVVLASDLAIAMSLDPAPRPGVVRREAGR